MVVVLDMGSSGIATPRGLSRICARDSLEQTSSRLLPSLALRTEQLAIATLGNLEDVCFCSSGCLVDRISTKVMGSVACLSQCISQIRAILPAGMST